MKNKNSKIWAGARFFSRSLRLREKSAFTLIEILLIIVIVAVVSTVAIVSAFKYKASQDLRLTLNELSALARDVQRKSITQEDGKRWGIRFENTQSGKDRVYIFKGTSFASGTVTQSMLLRRGAQFGEPGASSTRDVIFLPVEGTISPNKVITLNTGLQDGLFGDLVINLLGRVTTRTDTGLSGYWHLDEGTGSSTVDASGNGNDGVLTNAPIWGSGTSCKAGACLLLDGTNQYVTSTNFASLESDLSVSAWVYFSDFDAGHENPRLIEIQDGTWSAQILRDSAAGSWKTKHSKWETGSDSTSWGSPSAGAWYHVSAVWRPSASSTEFYVNGLLQSSSSSANVGTGDQPNKIYLGARSDLAATSFLKGYIDEVRVYSRALPATEISNIYNDLK